jgi:hypothetical protein
MNAFIKLIKDGIGKYHILAIITQSFYTSKKL